MYVKLVTCIFLMLQTVTSLQDFIRTYFPNKTTVFITSEFRYLDPESVSLLSLNLTKLVLTPQKALSIADFEHYIISEKNTTALVTSMEPLKYSVNTHGHFLVIVENNCTEEDIKELFETLWQWNIYNIVFLTNWTTFVTWYPYDASSHCGTVKNLVTVTKTLNPYKNKLPNHFEECNVTITWSPQGTSVKTPFNKTDPGYTIRMLDTVFEKMKIRVVYLTNNTQYMFYFFKHGNNQLLHEDMKQKHIDMGLVIGDLVVSEDPAIDVSVSYLTTYIFMVLPPRQKIISSLTLLVVFSRTTWMFIFFAMVSMVVLWKIIFKKTTSDSFFQIVQLLLKGLTSQKCRTTSQKLLCFFFFFYAMNLNSFYVSQLSGVLSKPSYEPKITNLKELAQSNKKLKFSTPIRKVLPPEDCDALMKNFIGLPGSQKFHNFVRQQDHGIAASYLDLLLIRNWEVLHVVSQQQVTHLHWFLYVKRGLPFLRQLNKNLRHTIESGLVYKWLYESQIYEKKLTVSVHTKVQEELDLRRICYAFFLLGAGLVSSFIVFLLEVLLARRNNRKNRGE